MKSPRSPEGKAARKFKESIDTLDFDASAFAYLFVDDDPLIQARAMVIVKALILAWAAQYSNGGYVEQYNTDAMRLRDTMDQFRMEAPNGG